MLWYGGAAVVLILIVAVLWLALGSGPRKGRSYRRAQHLLQEGKWLDALSTVRELQAMPPLSAAWEGRARSLMGECERAGSEAALAARDYEKAIGHAQTAAELLGLDLGQARNRILDAMLAEVYRLFAPGGIDEAERLLARILILQSPHPEATFWLGLFQLRRGNLDLALASLRTAREGKGKEFIDAPLYLGALLLRSGQPQEALRHLSEANRIEAGCPFVGWQLGQAIVAMGGDSGLAVRALQKALGPRGLPLWSRAPDKVWTEGFPGPARSFVSRFAAQQRYVCPVFGSDVSAMVRQGFLGLAQAQYRLGNYQESATIYGNLLQDAAPTLHVLRGLGLSLARLGRYDEAFKHLRAAHEQEEPKSPFTAGYLALCGAKGKPSRAEDKPNNVAWALRLMSRYFLLGDAEWASLHRAIFTEARALNVPVGLDDLMRCCDVLVSVEAADPESAAVYDQLALHHPESVRPAHAWLYCRAAQQHGFHGKADLVLFAAAFRQVAGLGNFYAQHQWDVEELEALYLARWSEPHPATFPEVLGPDYGPAGERLLLAQSFKHESAGQADAALHTAGVLLRLLPYSRHAHDRLACLYYRRGELDQAARVLHHWQTTHPDDPWAPIRRAVVEQQRNDPTAAIEAIDQALQSAQGSLRADVAFLGARLALTSLRPLLSPCSGEATGESAAGLGVSGHIERVFGFLETCLQERPDHAGALGLLTTMRWLMLDTNGIRSLAPRLAQPGIKDGRFQYFAAVGFLAVNDDAAAIDAAGRSSGEGALAIECQYLTGRAQLRRGDTGAAATALEKVARAPEAVSVNHARAWLGQVHFQAGNYDQAAFWWKAVEAGQRAAWKLDEPLRATLFLSALTAWEGNRFEDAAERFREAGRLGWRDRRLGPLLSLSLFKAGQRLLYQARGHDADSGLDVRDPAKLAEAAQFLNQAITTGCKDPAAHYLLALAHKHCDNPGEARAALRKIGEPDANVWLQMGLLSLQEKLPAQAETEFARAWELDSTSCAAAANLLFTRLSLGQTDHAARIIGSVIPLVRDETEARTLGLLRHLLESTGPLASGDGQLALARMTADDEQRLLQVLRGLGHLDMVCLLMHSLAKSRPDSDTVREANFEAVLLKGRKLVDRCEWGTAHRLLAGLVRQREMATHTLGALFNLSGCCACLNQEFPEGVKFFTAAVRATPNDGAIHQNLALAYEWQKNLTGAEPHWNRYFDILERRLTPSPHSPDSAAPVLFEGLHRLAGCYTEKEKWANALVYVERAHRLRPDDVDTLERLFTLYNQVRRPDDARRVLQRLRHLRPGEPQYALYELDLVELREIDDMDRWIGEIGRIVQAHPGEPRVEERALSMIGNMIPLMTRTGDQLTEQLNKVMRQVRGLPNYQIHWEKVHEVMRDLKRDFQKVRKTINKCMAVLTHSEHRRQLRTLGEHMDRKIEFCRDWQGN